MMLVGFGFGRGASSPSAHRRSMARSLVVVGKSRAGFGGGMSHCLRWMSKPWSLPASANIWAPGRGTSYKVQAAEQKSRQVTHLVEDLLGGFGQHHRLLEEVSDQL